MKNIFHILHLIYVFETRYMFMCCLKLSYLFQLVA